MFRSLLATVVLTGCAPGSLTSLENEAPGANCPHGGTAILAGQDLDRDGMLDVDEVDERAYVCNGSDGSDGADGIDGIDGADGLDAEPTSLVSVSEELAGANCAAGGQRIDWGVDDDRDQVLDAEEIDATAYVCSGMDGADGADGSDGSDGASGLSGIVSTNVEPAGANCEAGGLRVAWGLDLNENGVLDAEEEDGSSYVCAGLDGAVSLMQVVDEPAGANCEAGGQRVEHGIDDDGDQTLDPEEVDGTDYICNGVTPVSASCLLDFEAAYDNHGGGNPGLEYGSYGLTFEMDRGAGLIGGDAHGDPGNWSHNNSVPDAAWGLHDFGNEENTLRFDFEVDALEFDIRNGPPPNDVGDVTVDVYLGGQLVETRVFTLPGPITAQFEGPLDEVVTYLSAGTAFAYIIDDVRYESWDATCPPL